MEFCERIIGYLLREGSIRSKLGDIRIGSFFTSGSYEYLATSALSSLAHVRSISAQMYELLCTVMRCLDREDGYSVFIL